MFEMSISWRSRCSSSPTQMSLQRLYLFRLSARKVSILHSQLNHHLEPHYIQVIRQMLSRLSNLSWIFSNYRSILLLFFPPIIIRSNHLNNRKRSIIYKTQKSLEIKEENSNGGVSSPGKPIVNFPSLSSILILKIYFLLSFPLSSILYLSFQSYTSHS